MALGSFIEIDMTEINQLIDDFDKMRTDIPSAITNILSDVAVEYLSDLATKTPVDTGRLKRQWFLDNPNLAFKVVKDGDVYEVEVINTTPYAEWVEKGHWSYNQFGGPYGWVVGRFFVKNVETAWKAGKLDKLVERSFMEWIDTYL